MWNLEATYSLCWRRSFALTALLEWWQTSTAPSAFPAGDVSRKMWSTLITTQQEGIYLQKARLASLLTRVNSPPPKYWHITLHVYSVCTNILVLRVISVKQCACTADLAFFPASSRFSNAQCIETAWKIWSHTLRHGMHGFLWSFDIVALSNI